MRGCRRTAQATRLSQAAIAAALKANLSLSTLAGPLAFQRSYGSLATTTFLTSPLSYGWTDNQDTRLIFPSDPQGQPNIVWFKAHSANEYRFDITSTLGITTYTPYPGVLGSLSYATSPATSYTLTTSSQAVYLFDSAGRLTRWSDPQGHALIYDYDGSDRLITVTERLSGRYLAFSYTGSGQLTSVRDSASRQVSFGYSLTTGDLTTATDVLGQDWTYAYSGTTAGTRTITTSAIVSNTSAATSNGSGGGGIRDFGGTLTLVDVTLSGNQAIQGGGIQSVKNGGRAAVVNLNNVTIANNTADSDGTKRAHGGGLLQSSGTINLKNTLLAKNFDNSGSSPAPDCSGTLTSQGYNLLGNNAGCAMTANTGDRIGTSGSPLDPKLGPLQNNGGPTLTYALLTGSPAIDAGNPGTSGSGGNACAAADQRGAPRPVDGDANGGSACDIGALEAGGAVPPALPTVTTIVYTYDNLYRLVSAAYSTGTVFTYTYDAVGNRLSAGGPSGLISNTYDDANRLNSVGGVAYAWDNNGNLRSDGVFTYSYDAANRLTAFNTNVYTYTYDGLGDRVQQASASGPITYALDQAGGLTQVLAETSGGSATTYLYGQTRVAQQTSSGTDYFLPDALGSVRGLANATGQLTVQRSYDPFGQTLSSIGTDSSNFAFAGEYQDPSVLLFLRARYLSLDSGRFITKDTADWDYRNPQSENDWLYAYANPTNFVDASGLRPCTMLPTGRCEPEPIPVGPNQLRVAYLSGVDSSPDQNTLCANPTEAAPVQRTVTVDISPRLGVVSYTYNKTAATKSLKTNAEIPSTGDESVAIRAVLSEVAGRILPQNNIHGVQEAAGILFTAQNRAGIYAGVWGCSSMADCLYREHQYAVTVSSIGIDPLCQGTNGKDWCTSWYSTDSPVYQLEAVDLAAIAYMLVDQSRIVDFTRGSDSFIHRCGGTAYGETTENCSGKEDPNANVGPTVFYLCNYLYCDKTTPGTRAQVECEQVRNGEVSKCPTPPARK